MHTRDDEGELSPPSPTMLPPPGMLSRRHSLFGATALDETPEEVQPLSLRGIDTLTAEPESVAGPSGGQLKGKGVERPPSLSDVRQQVELNEVDVTTAEGQRFALRRIPGYDEHGLVLFHEDPKWEAYLRDLANCWKLEQGVNDAYAVIEPSREQFDRNVRGVLIGLGQAPSARNAVVYQELRGAPSDWHVIQASGGPGGAVGYILASKPGTDPGPGASGPVNGADRGHLMVSQSDVDHSVPLPTTMQGKLAGFAWDERGFAHVLDSEGEMWRCQVTTELRPDPQLDAVPPWERLDVPLDVKLEKIGTQNNKFVIASGRREDGSIARYTLGPRGWRPYDPAEPSVTEKAWGKVADKHPRKDHVYLGVLSRLRPGWASGEAPPYIQALPKAQRYLAEKGQLVRQQVTSGYTAAAQTAKQAARNATGVLPEPARYYANQGVDAAGTVIDAAIHVSPLMLKRYGLQLFGAALMKQVLKGANPALLTLPSLVTWAWKQRHALRRREPITMPGGPRREPESRWESAKGYFRRQLSSPTVVSTHFKHIRASLAASQDLMAGNGIQPAAPMPVEDGHRPLREQLLPVILSNIGKALDRIEYELGKPDFASPPEPTRPSGQANMPGAFPFEEDEPRRPQLYTTDKGRRFRAPQPVADNGNVLHQLAEQAAALCNNSGVAGAPETVQRLRRLVTDQRLVFDTKMSGTDDLTAFCAIQLKKIAYDLATGFETVAQVNGRVGQASAMGGNREPSRLSFVARTEEVVQAQVAKAVDKLEYALEGPNFEATHYDKLSKLQAAHSPDAVVQFLKDVSAQVRRLPAQHSPIEILLAVKNPVGKSPFQRMINRVGADEDRASAQLVRHLGLSEEFDRFLADRTLEAASKTAGYHHLHHADPDTVYSDSNLLYLVYQRHLVTFHSADPASARPHAANPGAPHPSYGDFDDSTKRLDFLLRRGIVIGAEPPKTGGAQDFFEPTHDLGVLAGHLLTDQLLIEQLAMEVTKKKGLALKAVGQLNGVGTGLLTLQTGLENMRRGTDGSYRDALSAAGPSQLPNVRVPPRVGRKTPEMVHDTFKAVVKQGPRLAAELEKIAAANQALQAWKDGGISSHRDWTALAERFEGLKDDNPIGMLFNQALTDMTAHHLLVLANRVHSPDSDPDSQMMRAAGLDGLIAPQDMDEFGDHLAREMPIDASITYKVETHWGGDGDGTGVSVRLGSRTSQGVREHPGQPPDADTMNIPLNRLPNLQPLYYLGYTHGRSVQVQKTKDGFRISLNNFQGADLKPLMIGLGKIMYGAGILTRNIVKLIDEAGNPELDDKGQPKTSMTALLLDYFGAEAVPNFCKIGVTKEGGLAFDFEENDIGSAHHVASKVLACKLNPMELLSWAVCTKELQRNVLKLDADSAFQILQAAVAIMTPNPRNLDTRFKGVVGALLQATIQGSIAWSSEKSNGGEDGEVYTKSMKLRERMAEWGLNYNTIDVSELQGSQQWKGFSPEDRLKTETGRADALANPGTDPHKALIGDFVEFEWKVPTGILVEIQNLYRGSSQPAAIEYDRNGRVTSFKSNTQVFNDFDEAHFPSLNDLRRESPVDHDRLMAGVERAKKAGLPINVSTEMTPQALVRYNAALRAAKDAFDAMKPKAPDPNAPLTEKVMHAIRQKKDQAVALYKGVLEQHNAAGIVKDDASHRVIDVSVGRTREFRDVQFSGFGWLRYKTGATATYNEPSAFLHYPLVWPDHTATAATALPPVLRSAPRGLFLESLGDAGFGELTNRLRDKPAIENAITSLRGEPERVLLTLLDTQPTTAALATGARTHVENATRQDAGEDHFALRGGAVWLRTRAADPGAGWNEARLTREQLARLLHAAPATRPPASPQPAAGPAMAGPATAGPSTAVPATAGVSAPGSARSSSTESSVGSSLESEVHVMLRHEREAQMANREWAQDILRLMSHAPAQAIPLGVDPANVLGEELDTLRSVAIPRMAAPGTAGLVDRPLHVSGILRAIQTAPAGTPYRLDTAQEHVMGTFFPHATEPYDQALVASMDAGDRATFSDAVDRIAGRVEGAILARVVEPAKPVTTRTTDIAPTHGAAVGGGP